MKVSAYALKGVIWIFTCRGRRWPDHTQLGACPILQKQSVLRTCSTRSSQEGHNKLFVTCPIRACKALCFPSSHNLCNCLQLTSAPPWPRGQLQCLSLVRHTAGTYTRHGFVQADLKVLPHSLLTCKLFEVICRAFCATYCKRRGNLGHQICKQHGVPEALPVGLTTHNMWNIALVCPQGSADGKGETVTIIGFTLGALHVAGVSA